MNLPRRRASWRATAAVALVLATTLSGCAGVERLFGPQYDLVQYTPLSTTDWNRDGRFRVVVTDAADPMIRIVATPLNSIATTNAAGRPLETTGFGDVNLDIPDGTWRIAYYLDGREWGEYEPVRIDATPPEATGLPGYVEAPTGSTVLSGQLSEPADVFVQDQRTGGVLGRSLPVTLTGLSDGLHLFLVRLTDGAGNVRNHTVQVNAGPPAQLPDGRYTFGVVARYTNEARLWPLDDLSAFATREAARGAAAAYLATAGAIEPDHPAVRAVVSHVVDPGMNTGEAAWAIYRWLVDNLEYDQSRVGSDDLLTASQTLAAGGGVCRDLAAAYVSLLRAAGVPARLVSGYLAGDVQGFHAWVEFYGGDVGGPTSWVPVDVSPIGRSDIAGDDAFDAVRALQSFGLLQADYLALRIVPAAGEAGNWSTALSSGYVYPEGRPPNVEFGKSVDSTQGGMTTDVDGVLCLNPDTRARRLASHGSECVGRFGGRYIPSFLQRTVRTIDYGVDVKAAVSGTTIDAEVAYPFEDAALPNGVAYRFYGPAFTLDPAEGKALAVIRR